MLSDFTRNLSNIMQKITLYCGNRQKTHTVMTSQLTYAIVEPREPVALTGILRRNRGGTCL